MTTARDIIKRAMLEVGVLTKGESPSADEADDALATMNALLSSWSNYGDLIYSRTKETFSLSSSPSYTIGSGQTFNTARPIQIIDAYVTSGTVDYPLVIITEETYDHIPFKTAAIGLPEYLTYNNAYPYGTITLYPVPDGSYSITLLTEKALTSLSTLDTVISFPEGVERALVKNLAVELAPQYGQQVSAELAQSARESLGSVKLAVVRSRPINAFPQARATGNIYSGYYV